MIPAASSFSEPSQKSPASRISPALFSPQPTAPDGSLAKGKFLVASANIGDPRFSESVILLIDYGIRGAFGLIINRPTEIKLSRVFTDMEGLKQRKDTLYVGGPVGNDQMFLLVHSDGQPEGSSRIFKNVYISGSKTLLKHIVDKPDMERKFRVYIGYAGWSAQQLDQEVARGDWYILSADAGIIFDKEASEIWPQLFRRSKAKWVMSTPLS